MVFVLEEYEKKIRKRWLLLTFFHFICYAFIITIITSIPLISAHPLEDELEGFYGSIIILFTSSVFFWIYYHCSYRRFDTDLLTFCLWAVPIGLIISTASLYIMGDLDFSLIFVIANAILIYWYILCWKLRKINKNILKRKNVIEGYQFTLNSLQNSPSLEDLNSRFSSLFEAYESRKLVLEKI